MQTISKEHAEFICDIQAPCFQSLSEEEMELIKTCKTQVKFRKGDMLTKQGAFAAYVLFIARGLGIQYVEGETDKNFNLRIIQPGEFVGLSAIFSNNTFNYSSVAIDECQAFLIEKAAISEIITQNGEFGMRLMRRYTEQNISVYTTLQKVLFKQMTGKIADVLLYIDALKSRYPEVFTLLSRKNLADFAGITTESMVKMLKTLEKEQIIALQGKDITLLNTAYLKDLMQKG